MAIKIDKFKGRLDFKNDSKDKISKTLSDLRDYLNKYGEDEAAAIVKQFEQSGGNNDKAHIEFKKLYEVRTNVLKGIAADIKRIQKDLIDEQGQKAKSGKASWKTKGKEVLGKTKDIATKAKDKEKSLFDRIKDALFGNLLGALVGKVLKAILKPLKWILAGLFGIGKFGAKLVFKAVKGILFAGLKAGGWIFKKMTGVFSQLWTKFATPALTGMADKIKSLSSSLLDKGKDLTGKGKDVAGSAATKVADFIKGAGSKVATFVADSKVQQSAIKGFDAVKGFAGSAATKVVEVGKGAAGFMSKGIKASWGILKDKVMSIGGKIVQAFSKKGGPAAGSAIAKKMPSILGKFASKFIPGIGWALLAYDVYSAFKKSDGAISFAVNLIDEVTGGLLGMAVSASVTDFDGENLGAYISNLVKGFDMGLSPEEMDITKDVNMKDLDAQVKQIDDLVNSQNNSFTDPEEVTKLEGKLNNNPAKQKVLDEYKRLQSEVQAGNLTAAQANDQLKVFMKQSLTDALPSNPSIKNPETGQELANNSTGTIEQIKQQDINIPSMDVNSATTVQTGMVTMQASMGLAAQTSAMVASNIAGQAAQQSINMSTMNVGGTGQGSVIVQG